MLQFTMLSSLCIAQRDFQYVYNTRNGLPSNNVKAVSQDNEGYIWIPSNKGITKFNGQTFKNFSVLDGLPTNDVFFASTLNENEVWIYDHSSYATYIKRDTVFSQKIKNYNKQSENIHKLYYKAFGEHIIATNKKNTTIIISNKGQVKSIDIENQLMSVPELKNILPNKIFDYSYRTSDSCRVSYSGDKIAVSFDSTIVIYDYGKRKTKCINVGARINNTIDAIPPQFFYKYFLFTCNRSHVLNFIDLDNDKQSKIDIADFIRCYKGSKSYIIEHDTVLSITSENNYYIEINKQLAIVDTFSFGENKEVNSINKDLYGNYWVATDNEGVFFISKHYLNFKKIELQFEVSAVIALFKHGNKYFLFDKESNMFITNQQFRLLKKVHLPVIKKSYPNISKYWFFVDAAFGYYIASAFGTYYLNNDFSIEKIIIPNSFSVKDYFYDSVSRNLTLATSQGLHILNKQEKDVVPHSGQLLVRIMNISKSTDGNYWCSNDNGQVLVFDDDLKILIDTTVNTEVSFSTIDRDNFIFSLEGYGIYYYNLHDHKVKPIIADDNFQYYQKSKNGFWVTNNNYIVQYKFKNGSYVVEKKYLNLNSVLYTTVYKISECDSVNYLLCDNGIIKLPDNQFTYSNSSFNSSAYLASIFLGNKKSYYFHRTDSAFSYLYTPENISLSFTCNSSGLLGNIKYRYKVDDNINWANSDNGLITYPAFEPGVHSIYIKADVNNINLSTDERVFTITVIPMWWQSVFLRIGVLTIIITTLIFFFYKRIIFVKKRERHQFMLDKKIDELELSALQSQMNPHFIFNSLTSIQSFINTHKTVEANSLLQQFSLLVRLYLDFSKYSLITIEKEIEALTLYTKIEDFRFHNKFTTRYFLRNSSNRDLNQLYIPPMLVQPIVENAINHGLYHKASQNGLLKIFIIINASTTKIVIDDNGIGREKSKRLRNKLFPSIGNKLINDRIQILNESKRASLSLTTIDKIDYKKNKSKGTRVKLIMKNIFSNAESDNS